MNQSMDLDEICKELDELHLMARHAFLYRDIDAYRLMFTEDLRYLQFDGKIIGLKQLLLDVSRQLSKFKSVDSEFIRESIAMNEDGTVSQVGRQRSTYSVSMLLFFTKTWRIDRRGKFTYRRSDDGWRVCEVQVMAETVKSQSLHS
jgi:hypothetical protein